MPAVVQTSMYMTVVYGRKIMPSSGQMNDVSAQTRSHRALNIQAIMRKRRGANPMPIASRQPHPNPINIWFSLFGKCTLAEPL
jgi:hypothetical protein